MTRSFAVVAGGAVVATLGWLSGCARSSPLAASSPNRASGDAILETDFSEQPPYVPNDTLSLTFDDGPLTPFTAQVLDVLKERGVHATFFINTDNNGNDVGGNAATGELVRRIVREGHVLGNHTAHHLSLRTLTPDRIEAEISRVEAIARDVLGDPATRLSLLRAPYGEPYQDYFYDHGDPAGATYPVVSSIVARHGVHVGWNVETDDWKCTTGDAVANADCVYEHFTAAVKTIGAPGAQWGIVLMHCVNPQTAAALPRILDYVEAQRFKLASVEDVVRMKFGKSSSELVDGR